MKKLPKSHKCVFDGLVTAKRLQWNSILHREHMHCQALVSSNVKLDKKSGFFLTLGQQDFWGETCQEDAAAWIRRHFFLEPEVKK